MNIKIRAWKNYRDLEEDGRIGVAWNVTVGYSVEETLRTSSLKIISFSIFNKISTSKIIFILAKLLVVSSRLQIKLSP